MVVNFTDGTTTGVVTRDLTNLNFKVLQVRVPATFVWGTDTLTIDLKKYGANYCAGVLALEETTAGSVTVPITGNTTAVTSGSLVVTSGSTGGSAGAYGGTFVIFAY